MTAPTNRSRPLTRTSRAALRLVPVAASVGLGLAAAGLVLAAPPTTEFRFDPQAPQPGQPVAFTYAGADPEGEPITVTWDLDGDGDFDDGSGPTAAFTYPSRGAYSVRVRVDDGNSGPVDSATQTVIVNTPPSADFAPSPAVPLLGQEVTLSSTSTDDAPIPPGGYAWELDGDGDFADAENAATITHRFTAAGPQEVKLRVTDSDGAVSEHTEAVTVNRRPLANFDYEPQTPRINEPVLFASQSTDPDGDATIVSQEWDLDGDGNYDDATGPQATGVYPEAGTRTVRLRVTDNGGAQSVRERRVIVQRLNPTGSFTFAPASPVPGQAVTFTSGSVASQGASGMRQQWDFESDGSFDAEGAVASVAYPTAGPRTVTLRVTDDNGFDVVRHPVVVNAPPDAALRFSPAAPVAGDTVEFTSLSVDPDGPIASEAWDLDGDGAFDDGTGRTAERSYPTAGARTVRLRVTDAGGVSDVASVVMNVGTRPAAARTRLKMLMPRPVIRIAGDRPARRSTRIRLLTVRARSGSLVAARCRGGSCPARALRRKRSMGKVIRLRWLERRLRVRTRIAISVTYPDRIGSYTSFKIRPRRRPLRRNLCLVPGRTRPQRCPLE